MDYQSTDIIRFSFTLRNRNLNRSANEKYFSRAVINQNSSRLVKLEQLSL
jgi:hypothetical protein